MKELIKLMSEGVWEKEDIFSLALLSSIAGESIFLLGPPGTGKSMIARRLKEVFAEKKQCKRIGIHVLPQKTDQERRLAQFC